MNKKEMYVEGMHCPSCELYIETQFKDIKGIKNVKSDNSTQKITFEIENSLDSDKIINDINERIEKNGYKITTEIQLKKSTLGNIPIAFLLALLFLFIFWGIQKLSIGNQVYSQEISYPLVFVIGLIASISSCMAVVGSLVLSLSSILNKNNQGHKSILVFHISRLIGFFLLGGMLGILGTLFLLSSTIEIAIGIFLFLVMLALGINLLDISPFFRKFEFTLPKNISSKFLNKKNMTNTIAPILFGAGTFFLPCGFTQAMQLNAVVSANFLDGALIMLVFALGTFPVLAIISFSSKRISQSKYSDLFFKTSGFIVIFFAIYNLIGTLVANGIISPIF